MRSINWIKFTGINLLFILILFLPFFPGPPNKLVVGLSIAAQLFGFFGLVLIPIGLAWSFVEFRRSTDNQIISKTSCYLAVAALVVCTLIYSIYIIALFTIDEWLAAIGLIILGLIGLWRAIIGFKKIRIAPARKFNSLPLFLISLPIIAFIITLNLLEPISDISRAMAINRTQPLINAVEQYKNEIGNYPKSLEDLKAGYLKKIPSPMVMGISGYRYNNINDQYTISFSQWLDFGSLEEIVLFDKYDVKNNLTGKYAEYNYKLDLCRLQGTSTSYSTKHPFWHYYRID